MSKDNITDYGKSIRSKLLNIAKKEDVFYQTILTRYFQERLLYRMSQTKYRSNFYLKGGALMYAYEKFAARPTLDIDFLGNNISNEGTTIVATFKEICSVPYEEDGITFDTDNITAQNITEFKELDYPVLLEQLPSVNIMAYSLETVIAEKMHAIVDLADQSSRMKDYYDLYNILSKEKYDVDTLQEAIMRTFENRHTSYDADTMFFRKDFADNQQMKVRWQAFLHKIIKSENVTFTDVVVYIQNELLPYWEKLSHE